MKSYNGFSGRQRQKVFDILKYLRDKGEVSWADKTCDMCGCSIGMIMAHSENYFNWLSFKICCVECHMKLHARFRAWNSWIDHLIQIRNGYTSKGFNSVMTYFGSKENRDFFKPKPLQPFTTQSNLWFENLKSCEVNIYRQEIDCNNYPENFIEKSWSIMRKEQKQLKHKSDTFSKRSFL